ncbi:MAG: hypothetical protein JNG88_07780 [Phycisphaerales bacterium]|nr:hypothetical protein [Phycisphaerales bacterium]
MKYGSRLVGISATTLLLMLVAHLTGCAGGGPSELALRPTAKPLRLDATIKSPGDLPLNLFSSPSQENPGPGGKADARAESKPSGDAIAIADVESGGGATASFQIGSAFVNDSDQQVDVTISAKYRYEFALQTNAKTRTGDATVTLHFYARDQYNRLLRDLPLFTQSTDQGSGGQSGENTINLTLTIGPHDSLYLFFGGSVAVDTLKSARTAHGELKLSGVELTLTTKAAPAVKAAAP